MQPGEKSQYELDQERRQADRRARAQARKAAKAAGMASLGGRTLSEALRGATSTRERREIKATYESAKTQATDPFAPRSSNTYSTGGSPMSQSASIEIDGSSTTVDIFTS
jgi:hypothetical protein